VWISRSDCSGGSSVNFSGSPAGASVNCPAATKEESTFLGPSKTGLVSSGRTWPRTLGVRKAGAAQNRTGPSGKFHW